MLPHVRRRPLNLWRWNAGIDRQRVVQQEIPKGAPDWVARVEVPRRRGGSVVHAMADDADTLVWLGQVNCVTPHVWTSRADRLDRPDRMIFDLDPPDEGADFDHIREGALAMGELLRELGREPYAMTSGSRGIHVIAPLRRTAVHDVVRERAREISEELAARHPDRLTTEWRKAKREGRILIDTARNTYAQTTVAPYAVRARRGAGRDAAALGGARGPAAAREHVHARHDPRAARARRRCLGGDRPGSRIDRDVQASARPHRSRPGPGLRGPRRVGGPRRRRRPPPSADDAPGASCTRSSPRP